jgi:hypothetical protein
VLYLTFRVYMRALVERKLPLQRAAWHAHRVVGFLEAYVQLFAEWFQ